MCGWRVTKRASPESEGGGARDSKAKSGDKGLAETSARSTAFCEDKLGKSIVARSGHARACGGPHRLLARAQIVECGGGRDWNRERTTWRKSSNEDEGTGWEPVHARGSGFRGGPHGRGRGAPQQVLETFMAHVAERQETVIECFGPFRVMEAHQAEETPATQQGKGDDDLQRVRVIKSEGGAGMLDEGFQVRDVRRAIAQNAENARGKEASGIRTEDGAAASGGEAVARTAPCSAELIERLKVMARRSSKAAELLARAERNQQLT